MKQVIQLGEKTTTAYREDELKIASALDKDCKIWFEAGANFFGSDLSLFNRSNGVNVASTTTNTNFTLNTSGVAPLLTPGINSNTYDLGSVSEFTYIFAGKLKSSILNRLFCYPSSYTPSSGVHTPHLFLNTSNRLEYNAIGISTPGTVAFVDLTSTQVNELAIYTVTFSTEKGLFIYRNGNVVASNQNFKTAIDGKNVCLRDPLSASFGHCILASIDLSKDENLAKNKLIHDALKKRYAIA